MHAACMLLCRQAGKQAASQPCIHVCVSMTMMYVCTYVSMYVPMYMCARVSMCGYAYIYMYVMICIHKYTHKEGVERDTKTQQITNIWSCHACNAKNDTTQFNAMNCMQCHALQSTTCVSACTHVDADLLPLTCSLFVAMDNIWSWPDPRLM